MTNNHEYRAHALLSPSSASRWLSCTPSARLEDAEPKKGSTSYSEEGTLAHEYSEIELKLALNRISEDEYMSLLKNILTSEHYSDEMDEEVEKYVTFVLEQIEKLDDPIMSIEEKIDLTNFIPEGFGSNDSVILADGILYVNDLKYGKGVKVNAFENKQLMLYGLGSLIKYDSIYEVDKVVLNIIQPRLNHIDTFEISAKDLLMWGETIVKPLAKKAFLGEGQLVAGEHCRFCKISHKCKALANKNLELAKYEFAEPKMLTDAELVDVIEAADMLVKWVESVRTHVFHQLLSGGKVEGFKLVRGRSNRTFTDEEAVKNILLAEGFDDDKIFKKQLQSLGVLEKSIGKKLFTELLTPYVSKPDGKPTLASESDERPVFKPNTAADDFAD